MESIPYDPALVLANIVEEKLLKAVLAVSEAGAPIDAAQEELDSLILAKRSLDMTVDELKGMGIDVTNVEKASAELGQKVADSASTLATTVIACQDKILKAKKDRAGVPVSASVESPLDYNKIAIKPLPLSADSIKMDAQYFSFDKNTQASSSTIAQIAGYVSASTSFLGTSRSLDATASAQAQATAQYQNHDVAGTLVITCGCTHKQAQLIAPLIIDPDKAVRCWNALYPSDMINPQNPATLIKIALQQDTPQDGHMRILSGATYGSSFVGMVHVLNTTTTESSETAISAAASLQATMTTGNWFASMEGGFGVSASFANDVKQMLSMQKVSSHCSMITMGVIPSVKSNQVKIGVQQFAGFDGATMMAQLATLSNATATEENTVETSAAAARTGGTMVALQAAQTQSVMAGLAAIDDGQNNMLDINSLMTAFEDYVNKVGTATTDTIGVPINYYIKTITKSQLAQLWVAKYYPKYLAIGGDDSGTTGAAAQAAQQKTS